MGKLFLYKALDTIEHFASGIGPPEWKRESEARHPFCPFSAVVC